MRMFCDTFDIFSHIFRYIFIWILVWNALYFPLNDNLQNCIKSKMQHKIPFLFFLLQGHQILVFFATMPLFRCTSPERRAPPRSPGCSPLRSSRRVQLTDILNPRRAFVTGSFQWLPVGLKSGVLQNASPSNQT